MIQWKWFCYKEIILDFEQLFQDSAELSYVDPIVRWLSRPLIQSSDDPVDSQLLFIEADLNLVIY